MFNDRTRMVLTQLRHFAEGCETVEEGGHRWRDVYLPNCTLADMGPHAFAGHLAQLERAGLYRNGGSPEFGVIRVTD